ncbi:MAG: T9SS type A sorting domain-containing protein [Bacteroidota bacterium]
MKKILFVVLFSIGFLSLQAQIANQPEDLRICDDEINDGIALFDLTITLPEILGAQDPTEFNITFHETLADAQNGVTPIATPEAYFNSVNPQSIFARLEAISSGDFDTTSFALIVWPRPTTQTPFPLEVCDDDGDGLAPFDLTVKDMEITNGDPNLFVSYHSTLIDAEFNVNPLPSPYINDVPFLQIVYARVENATTGCWNTVELELVVLGGCPDVISPPVDIFIDEGDENGLAEFDLTANESLMLGAQDPMVFLFSYHLTLEDAQQDNNPIVDPETYQNIENPQTIFVRFYNDTANGYVVTNFEIETDGILSMDENFSNSFSIYPNPVAEIMVIQSNEVFPNLEIALFDMNGRRLFSESNVANSNSLLLDISKFPAGMYLLQINSEEKTTVRQVVKR